MDKYEQVELLKKYKAHIINYHPLTKEMIESIPNMQPADIKEVLIIYDKLIQNVIESIS